MPNKSWVAIVLVATAVVVIPAPGAATSHCEDGVEERTGALKWAASLAVFSASTAVATRAVQVELRDGVCQTVFARCETYAADGSFLRVDVTPSASSYFASFRNLATFDDGSAVCASVRQFQGTNGVLRVLFEG